MSNRYRMQQALQRLKRASQRLKQEAQNPVIEIACTCGYHSKMRRNVHCLPKRCPRCGAGVRYL